MLKLITIKVSLTHGSLDVEWHDGVGILLSQRIQSQIRSHQSNVGDPVALVLAQLHQRFIVGQEEPLAGDHLIRQMECP